MFIFSTLRNLSYYFSTAVVTYYHKLSGLKQYTSYSSGDQKSKLGLCGLKSSVSWAVCFLEALGNNLFLAFFIFWNLLMFLGLAHFHLQGRQNNISYKSLCPPVSASLSLWFSCHSLSLIITLVITLGSLGKYLIIPPSQCLT